MSAKVTTPTGLSVSLSLPAIGRKVGTYAAKLVRNRLSRGMGARFGLPLDEKGGRPLHETGSLIRSIRYVPAKAVGLKRRGVLGTVYAAGVRVDGKRQMLILNSLGKRDAQLRAADPIGVTEEMSRESHRIAWGELSRQVVKKEAKLSASKRKTV